MAFRHLLISSAFAFLALALVPASVAASKKNKPAAADPALQSKALTIFLTAATDSCPAEGDKGFGVSTYVFSEAAKKYELKQTKLGPCAAYALPDLTVSGVATVAVLLSTLETNYETGKEDGSVSRSYPIYARVANEAAEKIFGRSFIAKRLQEKSGGGFMMYDPAAFQAAFDQLYFKPTETRGGVVAQQLYDAVFKKGIAEQAEVIAKVMAKKKEFEARAKDLLKRAETDESFYGGQFAYQAAVELNGGQLKDGEGTTEPLVEPGFMGTLLRRQADGTLPVILRSLKVVLKDYDPETFKKVGATL